MKEQVFVFHRNNLSCISWIISKFLYDNETEGLMYMNSGIKQRTEWLEIMFDYLLLLE